MRTQEMFPDDADTHANIATLQNEHAEAEKVIQRTVAIQSRRSKAQTWRGFKRVVKADLKKKANEAWAPKAAKVAYLWADNRPKSFDMLTCEMVQEYTKVANIDTSDL